MSSWPGAHTSAVQVDEKEAKVVVTASRLLSLSFYWTLFTLARTYLERSIAHSLCSVDFELPTRISAASRTRLPSLWNSISLSTTRAEVPSPGMEIDQNQPEHEHSGDDGKFESEPGGPAPAPTRAGKRVAELQQVEEVSTLAFLLPLCVGPTDEIYKHTQNIAALLHFAGCTLASLHPDPLSSFTVREIATDDPDDDADDADEQEGHQGSTKKPATPKTTDQDQEAAAAAKLQEFANYADGYFATLNVCMSLRARARGCCVLQHAR